MAKVIGHKQFVFLADCKGLFRNKFGLRYPTDNGGDGRNQLKKAELIFKQLLKDQASEEKAFA